MIVRHYGHNQFDPSKFVKIENSGWIKPIGGLWTSPINSEFGWVDFYDEQECAGLDMDINKYFDIHIKVDNMLVINSYDDLNILPWMKSEIGNAIDFEALAKVYDAFHLTLNGMRDCINGHIPGIDRTIWGWDCETILIMNKHCVEEI